MAQPLAEEPGREAELSSELPDSGALVQTRERVVHDRTKALRFLVLGFFGGPAHEFFRVDLCFVCDALLEI